MSNDEIITIKIKKNQLKKLKELGISPEEVFCKGLEDALRKKLRQFASPINELDELIEEDEYETFTLKDDKLNKFIISDDEIDNN